MYLAFGLETSKPLGFALSALQSLQVLFGISVLPDRVWIETVPLDRQRSLPHEAVVPASKTGEEYEP